MEHMSTMWKDGVTMTFMMSSMEKLMLTGTSINF